MYHIEILEKLEQKAIQKYGSWFNMSKKSSTSYFNQTWRFRHKPESIKLITLLQLCNDLDLEIIVRDKEESSS